MRTINFLNQSAAIDSRKALDLVSAVRETVAMSDDPLATLYLHRLDPTRNMARFYGISVQPTLFGSISLIRNWGRIGTLGRLKIETFDDLPALERAFGRIARRKRTRGYAEPASRQA